MCSFKSHTFIIVLNKIPSITILCFNCKILVYDLMNRKQEGKKKINNTRKEDVFYRLMSIFFLGTYMFILPIREENGRRKHEEK